MWILSWEFGPLQHASVSFKGIKFPLPLKVVGLIERPGNSFGRQNGIQLGRCSAGFQKAGLFRKITRSPFLGDVARLASSGALYTLLLGLACKYHTLHQWNNS